MAKVGVSGETWTVRAQLADTIVERPGVRDGDEARNCCTDARPSMRCSESGMFSASAYSCGGRVGLGIRKRLRASATRPGRSRTSSAMQAPTSSATSSVRPSVAAVPFRYLAAERSSPASIGLDETRGHALTLISGLRARHEDLAHVVHRGLAAA